MHANDYINIGNKVHRLIPSKFPPVLLFDWAESKDEVEQIAILEGLTNDRITCELGDINLVPNEDWVGGQGSSPLMAAFTHIGYPSRFSKGDFGVYYAADLLETSIKETVFHRERFYQASDEASCSISMREYICKVKEQLINITSPEYSSLLNPNPSDYKDSQNFGKKMRANKEWGLYYPSVRRSGGQCVAIFRPNALTIPTQGCHLKYIWDGSCITEVYKETKI